MNNPPAPQAVAGVILAGGRSRRMGGRSKAFLELAGKPLIEHVIDRLKPEVDCLIVSVECECPGFRRFGLPQVVDPAPGHNGPLGGLLAALRWLQLDGCAKWLLMAPCDAPFVPAGLAPRLLKCAGEAGLPGAVIHDRGEVQPTFSIWHLDLLPSLEKAVNVHGMSGFKQFLAVTALSEFHWPRRLSPAELPPFFNINHRQALLEAEALLDVTASRE